jgi:site-specific DNA-methyltransferase (adenine-specific)
MDNINSKNELCQFIKEAVYYRSPNRDFYLLHGDTFDLLPQFNFKFDMIFADPPYFLSSGGISVQSGKVVCVDKGEWDKSMTQDEINAFNLKWLSLCREKLKDSGTIWISGTYHNIFSVANCLTQLGYKILNVITWAKTNPPPNISCRYFTYSTEFIIWARKKEKVAHYYNYELMKHINDNKQMTDVWRLPAIAPWEKKCSKHPTQKPLGLLSRIIMASTKKDAWILDPFAGSSTTGIAANLLGRRYLGVEREEDFAKISMARREEIENGTVFATYKKKISDIVKAETMQLDLFPAQESRNVIYSLPFILKEEVSG